MNNRILVKVSACESSIAFKTVTKRQKSPHWFYILRSDLERLWRDGSVIANDIHSFARLHYERDRGVVNIRFAWLNAAGRDDLTGWEQTVRLPYDALAEFLACCQSDDGRKQWKALSLEDRIRPRLEFGAADNLHAALSAGWYAACGITSTGPVRTGSASTTIFRPTVFLSGSFDLAAQGSVAA